MTASTNLCESCHRSLSGQMWHRLDDMTICGPCYREASSIGLPVTCQHCGWHGVTNGTRETNEDMIEHDACADCIWWFRLAGESDLPDSIRIGGEHYTLTENPMARCGGRVRMLNGLDLGPVNLWSNGTIPERWRELLPDNAKWIT